MKLSEIKGQDAIDALADLIEPASIIFTDEKVVKAMRSGDKVKSVQVLLKSHPKEVIHMLAILEREDPATYNPSILTLPVKLLELFNDPDVQSVFLSQEQTEVKTSSSSAMANTEAGQN